MQHIRRETQIETLILDRILQLRHLSYTRVAALPEATNEEVLIAERKHMLSVYVQRIDTDELLVTVQVSRSSLLGLIGWHTERGLVFSPDGIVRDATSTELLVSGG